MASVGIIGAGIAGLAAAYELHRRGLDVTVFEATDRIGGFIQSKRIDGFLVELGPQTLQRTSADLEELLRRIDLEDRCIAAQPVASKRFIVRGSQPIPLPRSPRELLHTPLLSGRARLRLLAEPFIPRAHRSTEESVAQFARRRLGPEVLDYLVEPFVAGIFAGDPARLSVRHAFPKLFELEQTYGSLFWGSIRDRLKKRHDIAPRRSMFSFVEGLGMLPQALAERLPSPAILRNAEVLAIRWDEKNPWTLSFRKDGRALTRFFDVIVCATPLHRLAQIQILPPLNRQPLTTVEHPPIALVALGFRREQVAHPLDGFGMLVPAVEQELQILGTLFSSSLFPNRAPDGHVLLTTFVGGMRHPEQALLPEDQLETLVLRDLRRLLGLSGSPVFRHVWRWERSIPQYRLGYDAVIACVQDIEMSRYSLFLAGNYRDGISVIDALHSGLKAARLVIQHLREQAAGGLAKLILGD